MHSFGYPWLLVDIKRYQWLFIWILVMGIKAKFLNITLQHTIVCFVPASKISIYYLNQRSLMFHNDNVY